MIFIFMTIDIKKIQQQWISYILETIDDITIKSQMDELHNSIYNDVIYHLQV